MGVVSWWRQRSKPVSASAAGPRLRPAELAIERYHQQGADPASAREGALSQLAGLRRELSTDRGWDAIVRMARQAGDPWNADDWPLGFDALVCAAPLCADVSFECARCPVGQQQQGQSCAHPESAFGRIGVLVRQGRRDAVLQQITRIEEILDRPAAR